MRIVPRETFVSCARSKAPRSTQLAAKAKKQLAAKAKKSLALS
jgi:hypothetical protein